MLRLTRLMTIGAGLAAACAMPAWLDRDGRTQPLAPGMEVRNGDRIRTGADARVYLKLAEGSSVKLGENAQLDFHSRSLQPARSFRGALDILAGAFRFTTAALAKVKRRELAIRVGTATVGIRGTDVWGKSGPDRDLVVLIEGRIDIHRNGETIDMSEPMTVYVAPKGEAAQAPVPVDPVQFKAFARETDILPGDGAAGRGGQWAVVLGTTDTQAEALALYDAAQTAGFAARVVPRKPAEKWRYEVRLPGLASEAEAAVLAARVKAQLGIAAAPGR